MMDIRRISANWLSGRKQTDVFITGLTILACLYITSLLVKMNDNSFDGGLLHSYKYKGLFTNILRRFQQARANYDGDLDTDDYEDPEEIVARGFIRNLNGYCATVNSSHDQVIALPCSNVKHSLSTFTFTSRQRILFDDQCLTEENRLIYARPCKTHHIGQIWTKPTPENFIMALPDMNHYYGKCMYLFVNLQDQRGEIQVGDCWYKCKDYHFRPATWWVMNAPDKEPSEVEIEHLTQLEDMPWGNRFCIEFAGHVSEFKTWKRGDDAIAKANKNAA